MLNKILTLSAALLFISSIALAEGFETYQIVAGDTITSIGEKTLKINDQKHQAMLLIKNQITSQSQLLPGKVLQVPYSISKNRIATITMTVGSVKVNTGSGYVDAVKGMSLMQKHSILTADGSQAEIQLDEGSVVRVGPKTEFSLMNYAYNGGDRETNLDMSRGNMSMRVTKLTGESNFRVSTVTAVAGVRGTFFYVNYDETSKELGIAVYSGKVDVGLDKDKDGKIEEVKVEVPSGHATTISAAGVPAPIFKIPAKIQWAEESK